MLFDEDVEASRDGGGDDDAFVDTSLISQRELSAGCVQRPRPGRCPDHLRAECRPAGRRWKRSYGFHNSLSLR